MAMTGVSHERQPSSSSPMISIFQGENSGENPEPHDDGVLFPTNKLKMVMKRGHRKNAFAGEFETQDLKDHRDRFDDENTAHNHQQQFLFTADRHHADQPADGKRAGVTHENFRRVTIKQKEPETSADERGTNDREFGGERIKGDL